MVKLMRQWELDAALPEQIKTSLVILLPKKPTIERPMKMGGNSQMAAQDQSTASVGEIGSWHPRDPSGIDAIASS